MFQVNKAEIQCESEAQEKVQQAFSDILLGKSTKLLEAELRKFLRRFSYVSYHFWFPDEAV